MSIGIGMGLARSPFATGEDYFGWALLCEEIGIDSIWQTDRLVTRQPMLECLATMAALAGATKRIRFGMNVASIALRDPLLTARQCATVDFLSHGRLLPAFGLGTNLADDYRATGRPTRGRGALANEALELVSRLWKEESVSMQGNWFQYDNAGISPRPWNPDIPLWIGGSSRQAVARTLRFGTGWLAGLATPAQTAQVVADIKAGLRDSDRSIDEDHYGATVIFHLGEAEDAAVQATAGSLRETGRDPEQLLTVGDTTEVCRHIETLVAAGCQKFVLIPMAANGREGAAAVMEQTARVAREVIPQFA